MEIKRDKYGRPRVYLEEDCPVEELGIECQREGGVGLHPPVNRLHVWWARRPLTVSRASIIGSLLPAGYDRTDFLELIGIPRGADPIGARKKIDEVRAGIRKERVVDPYGYPRAFTHNLTDKERKSLKGSARLTWGVDEPIVMDSFAGGGSIPFESVRMGFNTIANELNPVATVIEKATIEYPMLFGLGLGKDIENIGKIIGDNVSTKIGSFFPRNQGEMDLSYIWVRTIRCPKCELTIPLSPNWWLNTKEKLGFQPIVPRSGEGNECSFRIAQESDDFDPSNGSVKRGVATCPRCRSIIDGDAVKREARDGNMGHQLAAVGYKMQGRSGRLFREAQKADLEGVEKARDELKRRLPEWQSRGIVPMEDIPEGNKTREPRNVGIVKWYQMFNDRQLLVHLTTLQAILDYPWNEIKDEKKREALRVYSQMAFGKCINYSSSMSNWHPTRVVIANTFDRHDYAFSYSPGEIDGAGSLINFGFYQIVDAYAGLAKLSINATSKITFINGDASQIGEVATGSITLVSIDPPYYDNVMYAECSDYFYVWMKRGLGDVFPELFSAELTDKTTEAVANPSQFRDMGRGKACGLASKDYEAKMLSAFREMHRVLRDDGVMTIMFTHKKVEAWDTMAQALLDAGFMITASWPIHTESEHSLHHAKKNAAASTILLVCRKRPSEQKTSWWDEVQTKVDDEVRMRAEEFESKGLRGQDTFIACFGPALQVISENWPVKRKDGTVIRPDEALDRARTTVSSWFMDRIAEGKAAELDVSTRFYILAWYLFRAREFRYDEARKLGLSLNVEVEDLIRRKLLSKKGDYVTFLKPQERAKDRGLRTDVKEYDTIVDLVQAAMFAYSEGKSAELKLFHQRTGALAVKGYKQAIEYLLDVLPRTAEVVEYSTLNAMWETNYQDIKRKVRNTDPTGEKQGRLDQFGGGDAEEEEGEESEEQ